MRTASRRRHVSVQILSSMSICRMHLSEGYFCERSQPRGKLISDFAARRVQECISQIMIGGICLAGRAAMRCACNENCKPQ